MGNFFQKTITNNVKTPLGNIQPILMHQIINKPKDKVIIVGDIHGCLDEMKLLLSKCEYNRDTCTLIFVGDLVNKGPYSVECVQYIRNLNQYCVKGNHDDQMLLHALNFHDKQIEPPKKYQYVKQLNSEDLDFVKNLPYTISLPSLHSIVVHAGLVPNKSLEEQLSVDMYTMRNLTKDNIAVSHGKDDSWASVWSKNKSNPHVYFGHDAKRGLQLYDNATGLDTGCCYGRELTAIVLPFRDIVQIKALHVYEEPKCEKDSKDNKKDKT